MLDTAPNSLTIAEVAAMLRDGPHTSIGYGSPTAARPYGFYSLKSRLKLAWAVFTGRADALFWPGQMPKAY